jgi:hypothetical protein
LPRFNARETVRNCFRGHLLFEKKENFKTEDFLYFSCQSRQVNFAVFDRLKTFSGECFCTKIEFSGDNQDMAKMKPLTTKEKLVSRTKTRLRKPVK